MDNNKLINQFIANLDRKGLDSSLLENDIFDFSQKFVIYNAIITGANLEVIANPNIDAYEMEDILDEQRAMMKEMRNNHGINPEYYNISQLLELNDALAHNLDISQYKNHEYTANHMYIAKTFQIEKLDGMDNITPDMPISELIKLRNNAREVKALHGLKNDGQNITQQSQSMQNNALEIILNNSIPAKDIRNKEGNLVFMGDLSLKDDHIRPKALGCIYSYFSAEAGINSTKNEINRLTRSEKYISGERDAVYSYEFSKNHLEKVVNNLRNEIDKIRDAILQEYPIVDKNLLSPKQLNYKDIYGILYSKHLIRVPDLYQLISNVVYVANNKDIELNPSRENQLSFTSGSMDYSQSGKTLNESMDSTSVSKDKMLFDNKGVNVNTFPNFKNNDEVLKFFNEINPNLVEQVLNKNEICFSMKGMIIHGAHAQENPQLLFELFASNCGFKATDMQPNSVISSQKQLQCKEM
ncbi:MAG: hypothetical protein K2P99_01725 [Burkholderiales bacterium]|nr:hypothetical protein [Burkholderiales bacterium]